MHSPLSGRASPLGAFGISMAAALGGRPRRPRRGPWAGGWPDQRATLDIDFTRDVAFAHGAGRPGALDLLTLSGGAGLTRINSRGELETVNGPALDWDPITLACRGLRMPAQRTNGIPRSDMSGTAGSPGTLPAGQSFTTSPGGLTRTLSFGTEAGASYMDMRLSGTATSSGSNVLSLTTSTAISAAVGEAWALSACIRLADGALGDATVSLRMAELDAGAASASPPVTQQLTLTADGLLQQRHVMQRILLGSLAPTAYVRPQVQINLTNGVTYDFTLRIALPGMEPTSASPAILTSGSAVTRTAVGAYIGPAVWRQVYNADEGTVIVTRTIEPGVLYGSPASVMVSGMSGGTIANSAAARFVATTGTPFTDVVGTVGSVNQFTSGGVLNPAAGVPLTTVFTYSRPGGYTAHITGGEVSVQAGGGIPVCDRGLLLGGWDGVANGDGHVQRYRYIPKALPLELLSQALETIA